MYLTPGRNPVTELLKSQVGCQEIFVESSIGNDAKVQEIRKLAEKRDVPIRELSHKNLSRKLPRNTVHQGVLAIAEDFSPILDVDKQLSDSLDQQCFIYIREALYEHNVGAIIRTAECLKVNGVIFPQKLTVTPNTTRIAMGANFHMPTNSMSLFNAIKKFRKAAYQVVAIERSDDKQLSDVNFELPTLLLIGGEDKAISQEVMAQVDHVASIPQFGEVNSLNMSVAASIAMYERIRQIKI